MKNYYKIQESEHYDYPQLCVFQDKIDPDQFKNNIKRKKEINTEKTVLYIHIPFCKRFCIFCNYYKELLDNNRLELYCETLIKEINTYGEILPDKLKDIAAIHFGGGTPSVLKIEMLSKILAAIKANFRLETGCTVSIEGNVRDFSDQKYISEIVDTEINRVSFGVQSFDEDLRRKYGLCDLSYVYKTLENLSKTDLKDYNADLMYNFPEQTPESVMIDIEKVLELGVRTFDFYTLNVFPNTYMQNYLIKNDTYNIYKHKKEKNVFKEVYEYMESAENIYPVMSNTFSKEVIEPYKFLKYHLGGNKVNGGSIIGMGASSRGYINDITYKNYVNIDDYIKAVNQKGGIAVNLGRKVETSELNRRALVMFPNFTQINKKDFIHDEVIDETFSCLIETGIVHEDKDRYYLKVSDCYWAGNISAEFYSRKQKSRMAKSFLLSMKNNLNLYNQDDMIIQKRG